MAVAQQLSCPETRGIFPEETKPVSPELQGRFLTTGPPGKPSVLFLKWGQRILPTVSVNKGRYDNEANSPCSHRRLHPEEVPVQEAGGMQAPES